MIKFNFLKTFFLLSVLFLLTGCGEKKTGVDIPGNTEIIKLSEIIKDPIKYNEKKIILEGNFFITCADAGCEDDFTLKEGINSIMVMTKGFTIPKIAQGQPVKVYGLLKSTTENPYIQALGLEVKK